MLIVGLTGNVAAGKSAVAELWREAGVPVVSADRLARTAVEPGTEALARIEELFGPGVIQPDGALDRGAVRRIVFRDEDALRHLEAIVHPEVRRLRDEWTRRRREEGAGMVVWEIPLLFETGIEDEVDVVVVVDAPAGVRKRRVVETRGIGDEEAVAIMASQMAADEKRRRADVVVENGGT
ncbi:MAG: dephospho-CoA kinase, partial [Gemmatimonadetes bacterium]|nr:dephospho-CoA kinase [Gemmatimonadota bacterium]